MNVVGILALTTKKTGQSFERHHHHLSHHSLPRIQSFHVDIAPLSPVKAACTFRAPLRQQRNAYKWPSFDRVVHPNALSPSVHQTR